MADYRLAGDKGGYSEAFAKYEMIFVRRWFVPIVLGIFALIAGLYIAGTRVWRHARRLAGGR